jgi:hypothetical protein
MNTTAPDRAARVMLRRCARPWRAAQGGAERVASGQRDLEALIGEALRQLADAGRLARAVHADDEDHVGMGRAVDSQRLFAGLQDALQTRAQRGQQRVGVAELVTGDAPVEIREDLAGGLDADVGAEQPRFQVLHQLGVDAPAAEQSREIARQRTGALIQARPQAPEESPGCGVTGGFRWRTGQHVVFLHESRHSRAADCFHRCGVATIATAPLVRLRAWRSP